MKPLLPTLRNKRRYLAFQIHSQHPFQARNVLQAVQHTVLEQEGIKGLALHDLNMPLFDEKTQKGILRVNNTKMTDLIANLSFVQTIYQHPAIIQTLKASGTIKTIKELT